MKQGFYDQKFKVCEFADSKQISGSFYILQHDLHYVSADGIKYTVLEGFIHDGASKAFLKRFGKYSNAAILHDVLYRSHVVSRYDADELFLEAMKYSGVSSWRAYSYYWTVRAFGGFSYSKPTEEIVDGLAHVYITKPEDLI